MYVLKGPGARCGDMTSADIYADDVLVDAGNVHGGILTYDARRSVDGGIRHCKPNARCSQLSTHEAELLAALHAHSAWTDWISTLRPENMHIHEWPAEPERRLHAESARGLHRTASRL